MYLNLTEYCNKKHKIHNYLCFAMVNLLDTDLDKIAVQCYELL